MNGFGKQINISRLLMTETGRYNQMFLRPMTTNIGADAVSKIDSATHGFVNVNPKALRDFAGEIIAPSADPVGMANIDGGWGTRRFRFILTVDEVNQFNPQDSTTRVLYGYTDEGRMDPSGIDPNQRFYFNSETVVVNNTQRTANGLMKIPRVMGSNQIINGFSSGESAPVYGQANAIYTIRPEDVYTSIQNETVLQHLQQGRMFGNNNGLHYANIDQPTQIIDGRNQFGTGLEQKLARRHEHAPAFFLNEVLRGYKEGMAEAEDPTERGSVAAMAQSAIQNQSIVTNHFLCKLRENCGYAAKGFVTYHELTTLFPDLRMKTRCVSSNGVAGTQRIIVGAGTRQGPGNGLSDGTDSQHWGGATAETIAATMLGQIVPAIMASTMFETIAFTAFNGMGGRNDFMVNLIPESMRMIVDGLNASYWGQTFQAQLKDQVLIPITFGNQRTFSMTVSCDIVGETIVEISLDGGPMERFVAPSFSNSLTTSLATTNYDHSKTIASDMDFLVQSLGEGNRHQMGAQSPLVGTGVPDQYSTPTNDQVL